MVLMLAFRGSKVRGASCGVRMMCKVKTIVCERLSFQTGTGTAFSRGGSTKVAASGVEKEDGEEEETNEGDSGEYPEEKLSLIILDTMRIGRCCGCERS